MSNAQVSIWTSPHAQHPCGSTLWNSATNPHNLFSPFISLSIEPNVTRYSYISKLTFQPHLWPLGGAGPGRRGGDDAVGTGSDRHGVDTDGRVCVRPLDHQECANVIQGPKQHAQLKCPASRHRADLCQESFQVAGDQLLRDLNGAREDSPHTLVLIRHQFLLAESTNGVLKRLRRHPGVMVHSLDLHNQHRAWLNWLRQAKGFLDGMDGMARKPRVAHRVDLCRQFLGLEPFELIQIGLHATCDQDRIRLDESTLALA